MKLILTILSLMIEAVTVAQGIVLWDESVNGPFSFDYKNPTSLGNLSPGTNSLAGKTEIEPTGNSFFVHEDYFTFAIPANLTVKSVVLQIDTPNVWAWIGDASYSTELAFAPNPSSGDLMPQWGIASLMPGIYGMYMANQNEQPFTSIANYRLDFVVQAIPEPGTFSLLLAGAACVVTWRWRKKLPLTSR